MYVCVCRSVTHAEIVERVRDGAGCFDALQFETGVGTCCGRCEDTARSLVADTLRTVAIAPPAARRGCAGAASLAAQGPCACAAEPAAECNGAAAAGDAPAVGPAAGAVRVPPVPRRLPISARRM